MSHPFQCRCATLRGEIADPAHGLRAACYCGDCQTYAHLLGAPQQVLDPLGGTEVVATLAGNVRFTTATDALACLSLSPRGLVRWYASCCHTPIANTPRNHKLPFVGLVHTCLRQPEPLERSFPEVQLRAYTRHAKGVPSGYGRLGGLVRFGSIAARLAAARLTGGYRQTPFFTADGAPASEPVVAARDAVDAARRAAVG